MNTMEDPRPEALLGLSPEEVEASRREHGSNVLTPPVREPWWRLFLEKFDDPVIRILMIAAMLSLAASAAHGEYLESVGIIVAIFLATTMAFANEYQAGREFDLLYQVSDEIPVKVMRAGGYATVPRKDVVVGDIVLLEGGDEIPADARVLEATSLLVDESRLTGESLPVEKVPEVPGEADPTEHAYPPGVVLRGSLVAEGQGTVGVEQVGDRTETGKAAVAAAEGGDQKTPLNEQLEQLSRWIGVIGFGVAALTYAALVGQGVLRGDLAMAAGQWLFTGLLFLGVAIALVHLWLPVCYDAVDLAGLAVSRPAFLDRGGLAGWGRTCAAGGAVFILGAGIGRALGLFPPELAHSVPPQVATELLKFFMVAVTIIVVAVPEGLAMSVTLSLAYSMRKMAASHVLVRKMHACETMGATTVICSDKTGTLTTNQMTVREVEAPSLSSSSPVTSASPVSMCLSVNSTAHLTEAGGDAVHTVGNSTEGALLTWLRSQGVDYLPLRQGAVVEHQWLFSPVRKFMATLCSPPSGAAPPMGEALARAKEEALPVGVTDIPPGATATLYVKGAPELVLERCSHELGPGGSRPLDNRSAILERLEQCQARAGRTIGLACCDVARAKDAPTTEEDLDSLARDMTWLGFFSLEDPVRPEVPEALQACLQAGIAVKIVTGDSPQTAREVAREIGLLPDQEEPGAVITGREFEALDDDTAAQAASALKILARARPLDKLRLVRLLQGQGHVVAVTGDGTNDAPALKQAHVGLAMGLSGTAVAREASDIILLDDSFASVRQSVLWGRSLYQNIQRFILFQLTVNVAALAIALLGPFIGIKLPLTVTQMLWINLIMDTFAALALATEPPHASVMQDPPRDRQAFIVNPSMRVRIVSMGTLFVLVLAGCLWFIKRDGTATPHELSLFFTVFVMLQFWNLFNARCLGVAESAFSRLRDNPGFICIATVILIGQVLAVQYGGSVFRLTPLSLVEWAYIVAATSTVLWGGELLRWRQRLGSEHDH